MWLGMAPTNASASQLLEGSPADRMIFAILMAVGLVVLMFRLGRVARCSGQAADPTLLRFLPAQRVWSDFPGVAFKRWTKAIGDLVMVLIVVTEREADCGTWALHTRAGFVLLPASILLINTTVIWPHL